MIIYEYEERQPAYPKHTKTDLEDMQIGVNNIFRQFPIVANNNFTLKPISLRVDNLVTHKILAKTLIISKCSISFGIDVPK